MMNITQMTPAQDQLGEGPLWDPFGGCLYWVDSTAALLRRQDSAGVVTTWQLPTMIGSLALCASPGMLVMALQNGIALFRPESGELTPVADPEAHLPDTRFNDGKTDRTGNFLTGTMGMKVRDPAPGSLYRVTPALTVEVLLDNVAVANGPCFSPDGKTFYFNEGRRQIMAFDYDAAGPLSNRRVFFDGATHATGSDGATVDNEGNVWVALIGSGEIGCIAPDGQLLTRISMPVDLPSSVMFGGPDLDELYVTSISDSGNRRGTAPAAGALFKVTGIGARGLPEPRFAYSSSG